MLLSNHGGAHSNPLFVVSRLTDPVVASVQHLDHSQLKHRSLHKGTHDVYDTTQYQIE